MKKSCLFILMILTSLIFTGCFSEKKSPFYNSEWVMQNLDNNNQLYYHHLILSPAHKAMLRVSYADSTNIIVWNGTYKINSKKVVFNFTECVRYENGKITGQYPSGKLVKFYTGEYLYSVATLEEADGTSRYHLQLMRPKNYFYGETKDIFGNFFDEFIRIED